MLARRCFVPVLPSATRAHSRYLLGQGLLLPICSSDTVETAVAVVPGPARRRGWLRKLIPTNYLPRSSWCWRLTVLSATGASRFASSLSRFLRRKRRSNHPVRLLHAHLRRVPPPPRFATRARSSLGHHSHTPLVLQDPTPAFPRYIYKLTSFENIEDNDHSKTYLIDVIGVLTQIDPLHLVGFNSSSLTRDIFITNTRLCSKHLPADICIIWLCKHDNGCSTSKLGQVYLCGNVVCAWYFNPDIREIHVFYNSHKVTSALLLFHVFYKTIDGGFHLAPNARGLQLRPLLDTDAQRATRQTRFRYKLRLLLLMELLKQNSFVLII
ncbi:hypothetical protein ZEAMMB73_Zm00001d037007 [Zea mays]|uniref:Uncharacterized protein n=1 Tax=Zea mays TaxID=4577 RepID=A0A1D6LTB9_MAIZE|nr:hypothetical protein ZEAMMB73_Zm00001d037007 [Zea mays]